jgi:iron-sulfur cluster assembly protein
MMTRELYRDKDDKKPPQAPDSGFVVTEAAAKEIERQRKKRGTPDGIIRIGLRGGGCSGYAYFFDWDDNAPRPDDHVFHQHGATVVIDPKSFKLLEGTTLDHTSSLMGHGFKFDNPRAKKTCGCGESVEFE